ncbi:MAG: hypothetical protein K2F84_06200 [Bacteroidales bacterium]|nr:hypothetical protein [Bacteroidales bacterium]
MDGLHFRPRGRQTAWRWALCLFILISGDPTGLARGRAAEPQPVFPACLQPAFRTLYLPDMGVGHPALLAANSLYERADAAGRPDGGAATRRLRGQAGVYSYLGFIPENKKTGLGGALSLGRHTIGMHYEFEGFSLYHRHSAGLSYAMAFTDQWQGGVFVRYRRRNRIEDVADKGAVESGLSVACRLEHWNLSFKAAYEIPLQGSGIWQQALSLLLTASYALSDDLCIGVEVGKDIRYPVEAAAAVAYRIKGHFMVFGLCGVYPFRFSLGGGYTAPRFDILVSTAYHPPLGATGQISVSWKAW